jgi:hypothetical protein
MTKDCCAAESLEQKSGTSLLLFEVYNQGIVVIDHIAYCPLVIFSIFLPKSLFAAYQSIGNGGKDKLFTGAIRSRQ